MYFKHNGKSSTKKNKTAHEDIYQLPQIYCSRGKCKILAKVWSKNSFFVRCTLRENRKQHN
jgi:hypothetical protein